MRYECRKPISILFTVIVLITMFGINFKVVNAEEIEGQEQSSEGLDINLIASIGFMSELDEESEIELDMTLLGIDGYLAYKTNKGAFGIMASYERGSGEVAIVEGFGISVTGHILTLCPTYTYHEGKNKLIGSIGIYRSSYKFSIGELDFSDSGLSLAITYLYQLHERINVMAKVRLGPDSTVSVGIGF